MRPWSLALLGALNLAPLLAAMSPQSLAGQATAPARAEVLVLGVYHMANPGQDIVNMQADDVLTPKRQGEIAELIAVLKKYQPTKIAVERNAGDKRISKDYADYLADQHQLTRNEIEQIGFRLAKVLGHKTVYPVDADGEFPYPRLVKYATATGRSKELDAIIGEIGDRVRATGAYLASHTVLETLLDMNSDEHVAEDVGFYYRQAHLGRALGLGRRRLGLRLVPAQHAHLQQRHAARRVPNRARVGHLRRRAPRLAPTQLRQRPHRTPAQAR